MKKTIVISLGGSLIIPKEIDIQFLKKLRKTILENTKKYKFAIVCGGGVIARKYISALKAQGKSPREQSLAGIRATRENAKFIMQFFGKKYCNDSLPLNMKQISSQLKKNPIVVCGALRYSPKSTSDETAAKLAKFLKTEFINLSNVSGLYTKNPKKYKSAKFIPRISWKDFEKMASKIPYKPGQNFVLDQRAAKIIKKHKIPTYLLGKNPSNLSKLLNKKPFKGTIIQG
jgi:uridylate kinase